MRPAARSKHAEDASSEDPFERRRNTANRSVALARDVDALCGAAVRFVHSISSLDSVTLFFIGPPEHRTLVHALAPASSMLKVNYVSRVHTRLGAVDARAAAQQESLTPAQRAFLDYLVEKALDSWTPET